MAEGAGFEPADPFGIVRFRVECLKPDSATLPEGSEANDRNIVASTSLRKLKGPSSPSVPLTQKFCVVSEIFSKKEKSW
jgi:hypothetical protein